MFKKLLSKRGLSLERLHSFMVVAEAGGIASGIGDDPVRQSLVSRQIKELEEFFGAELIHRRGRGLEITAHGKKLARLIREKLTGLEDFAGQCSKQDVRVSIGAGNSLLEWLVLPRIHKVQRLFGDAVIELRNLRTDEIVKGLSEMTLDFGLLRSTALQKPLKGSSLGVLKFRLFLPKGMLPTSWGKGWRWLERIPLTTYQGGVFGQTLERDQLMADMPIHIALSCSSFTQALRALETGCYGAILPTLTDAFIDKKQFQPMDPPFLREHTREIVLAWNPRLLRLKESLGPALGQMREILKMIVAR